MPGKVTYSIEGLREFDAALGELPRATARNVLHRTLRRSGKVIADEAKQLAPDDPATDPPNDLKSNIIVSTKVRNRIGNAEYATVMRLGGTRDMALSAMRAARRWAGALDSFAEVFVGPRAGRNSRVGALQEFGTAHHRPQPFMRTAWAVKAHEALGVIRKELGNEIDKAAKRMAAKARRLRGR